MTFVLSDNSLNSYSFRLLTSGVRLERFRENPVLFAFHGNYGYHMPVGKWTNIRVENERLLADTEFDEKDDFAQEIKGKVDNGYLKAASIGLDIIAYSEDPALMLQGQRRPTVTEWEPFEASIVPVGSNKNALKLRNQAGLTLQGEMPEALVDQILPKIELNQNEMDLSKLALSIGLSNDATEEQVMNKIKELQKQAPNGEQEHGKSGGDTAKLVEPVLKLGRAKGLINDQNATHYKKLAEKDADAVLSLIDSHEAQGAEGGKEKKAGDNQETETLAQALKRLSKQGGGEEELKSWDDFQKKDPAKLELMRKEKPEEFKKIYREKYGVTPKV